MKYHQHKQVFPRTLTEAFGPYTSSNFVEEFQPMDKQDKIVLSVCCIALVFVGFVFAVWG